MEHWDKVRLGLQLEKYMRKSNSRLIRKIVYALENNISIYDIKLNDLQIRKLLGRNFNKKDLEHINNIMFYGRSR